MITEAYCSFEVAKLLKDKGFEMLVVSRAEQGIPVVPEFIPITHQSAMAWLREEKGIFIVIKVYSGLPVQFGDDIDMLYPDKTLVDKGGMFGFDSYEEATERGLKYVLKNLI